MSVTECHGTIRLPRRTICLAGCAAVLAALSGCTQKARIFPMGEKVQVGGVIYTVLDAEWTGELDPGSPTARTPTHRYLLVHLSVNNAGSKEVNLPLLNAVDSAGQEHLELSEGQGVVEWLGLLRPLNPTESKDGRIVFDIPMGAYNLRLSDGGDPESERTALVALPPASKQGMESPLLNQPKQQE